MIGLGFGQTGARMQNGDLRLDVERSVPVTRASTKRLAGMSMADAVETICRRCVISRFHLTIAQTWLAIVTASVCPRWTSVMRLIRDSAHAIEQVVMTDDMFSFPVITNA